MRRAIQLTVLSLLVLICMNSARQMDLFKAQGKLQDVYAAPESGLSTIVDKMPFLNRITGNAWHLRIANLSITDPLAVLEHIATTRSVDAQFLLSALLLTLITLLLGRVFCAYICPMGILFDINNAMRRLLQRIGFRLPTASLPRQTKYLILTVGLLIALITSNYVLAWIYPPRLFSAELNSFFLTGSLRFGAVFLLVILFVELLFAPRIWCRCLCPGGALYSLLGRYRLLRIKRLASSCNDCGDCAAVCPHDLRPDRSPPGMECDNCRQCASACEPNALRFIAPIQRTAPATKDTKHALSRRDFMNAAGSSALCAAGLTHLSFVRAIAKHENAIAVYLRPPGATPEEDFMTRCIRCGACALVCDPDCIRFFTRPDTHQDTPYILPQEKACELCMKCVKVCPSGALRDIPIEEVNMGKAKLSKDLCLSHRGQGVCEVCYQCCPRKGKAITQEILRLKPVFHSDHCTGCGKCEEGCPVRSKAVRVVPAHVHINKDGVKGTEMS